MSVYTYLQDSVHGIRDRIYGFVNLAFPISHTSSDESSYFESPTMAMDISFGTTGYALTLARAFHNVCVYSYICV